MSTLSIAVMLARVTDARDDALAKERELVAAAQAGREQALAQLLRTHGPSLYRHVLLPRLGSKAAAEDALSETYARVIERIGQFRWTGVGLYPWLRVVALRVALDQIRKSRRVLLWTEEEVANELDDSMREAPTDQILGERREEARTRAKIEQALERLNPRYRTAIRLRILEEKPRSEVAETLGVTPATFDVVLHRAMAALRKELEGDHARED